MTGIYECVIVANGLFPSRPEILEVIRTAGFVIACDAAVAGLEACREPDAVVGDLDSLSPESRQRYLDRTYRIADQETNDLPRLSVLPGRKAIRKCLYWEPQVCVRTMPWETYLCCWSMQIFSGGSRCGRISDVSFR